MDINLGCGELEIKGEECVNVDIRETGITDVVHDLEVLPWPFKDEEFEDAYALDILEHLWTGYKFVTGIDEIWRIVKPGGQLYIRTCFFQHEFAYADPTHQHYFTLNSFDYWDPATPMGNKYSYSDKKWHIVSRKFEGNELLIHMEKIDELIDLP